MRLVLFTAHYPYRGEVFLEDEIRAAEHYFSEIIFVTLEKNPDHVSYYIPQNAKIVPVRSDSNRVFGILRAACSVLFHKKTICEIARAFKERRKHDFIGALKAIVIDERSMILLRKAEKNWIGSKKETVYYSYWLNAAATYLARSRQQLGGLCISRAHGGDCFFNRTFHPYRVEQLSGLDCVFPISEAGREDLLIHYGDAVPELVKKIHIARLGIVKPTNQMNPENTSDYRIIATCSNVIRLKRLDLLIDALSRIESIKIHWIHFGDGDQMQVIKKLAAERLKPNVVADFRGFVPNSYILRYYADNPVDVFINCSDAEGIPVSVMEAMSYGIPVIARDVGGIPELVNNKCGILLNTDTDGKTLAEAIMFILNMDKVTYRTMQQNAFLQYTERFSAEKNYKAFFMTIIEKVIQRL